MRARSAFEYAIVRVVPQVEREEFVNAGVILFCEDSALLLARIELDEARLLALAPETSPPHAGMTDAPEEVLERLVARVVRTPRASTHSPPPREPR